MPVLPWPVSLCPRSVRFQLQNQSRSGGLSLTGAEQIVASPAARWLAAVSLAIHTDDQVLDFRALLAGLNGRVNTVLVPAFDSRRAPWSRDSAGRAITPARAAGRLGLDASIRYRAVGPVARGSTSISVWVEGGSRPRPGQYLSVGDHLHVIASVTPSPAGFLTLGLAPGLRVAVASGDMLELVLPVCLMRLANDEEGAMDLDLRRFADVTLNFVEVF